MSEGHFGDPGRLGQHGTTGSRWCPLVGADVCDGYVIKVVDAGAYGPAR